MNRGHWLVVSLLAGGLAPFGCASGTPSTQDNPNETPDGSTPVMEAAPPSDAGKPVVDVTTSMEAEASAPDATTDVLLIDGGPPTVTPAALNFGLVACGASAAAAQTFVIDNPSDIDVMWTASLGKGMNSAFTVAPASGTLMPGQSVTVTVTPMAVPKTSSTAANGLGDLVTVTLNSSSVTVNVQETAQGAVLAFNPASIPFGSTPLGSSLSANFEVENLGNVSVSDLTVALTGDPSFLLAGAAVVTIGGGQDGGDAQDAGSAQDAGDAASGDAGGAEDAAAEDATSAGDATTDATADAGGGDGSGAGSADATVADAAAEAMTAEIETQSADAGAAPRSTVTFSPTTISPVLGSIAVSVGPNDVLCAPLPAPLSLSGIGTSGKVVVSPTSFVVSADPTGVNTQVPCGESALPVSVSIQNTGTAAFNWNATLTHGNGTFYSLSATSGAVAPMGSTTLTITPKAIPTTASTAANAFGDTLTVTTNAQGDRPHTVSLNETAQGAIISRSLNSLGFGNVAMGTTSTQTYTFTNTGNVDATLTFSNGNGAFVQNSPLTLSASTGTFVSESVQFQPTMVQSYSDIGLVALQTQVPLCGAFPGNLGLSGTGTNPTLTAVPTTLNFGSVPCGSAPMNSQMVTITNNGPATTYSAVLLKGVGSQFMISPSSGNLTAGGTAMITVTGIAIPSMASTSSNAFGDTLQVTSGLNNIVDVTLNMTALGSILAFNKASIPFGPTAPNTPVTSSVTLTNTGNYTASVTLGFTSTYPVFGVMPGGGTIATGQGLSLAPSFDPTLSTAMPYSGTMTVSVPSGAPLCLPLPTLPLTGTAN